MSLPVDISTERAAQIGVVFRQLPITLTVTVVNSLVVGAVVAPSVDNTWLLAWIGALALQATVRFWVWSRFRHAPIATCAARRWRMASIGGALASGLLWGGFSILLMPWNEPYPVFTAFVIAGMCAGAATVSSTHLPTVVAFILPAALPLAARFALNGTRLDIAMAGMIAIFAVSLVLAAARFGAFFLESVRTQNDLARQSAALAETNARLRTEMSEHRATEAALRHSQKLEAIGSLTAGVAHDINNLLMAISGSAELLQMRKAILPEGAPQLAAVFRATARGSRLTRHLLAFARQEVMAPGPLDLNDLLVGVTALLEATLGKSIRIELQLHPQLWPAYADRNEIERAVLNLAINARDAMPAGGTLTLRTKNGAFPEPQSLDDPPTGPCVVLVVADTGTGMPKQVRERAFDPYFTTKPAGQGSGLGLSQVYGVMKQLRGTTEIASAEGVGTTVRLLLPRSETAPSAMPRGVAASDRAAQLAPHGEIPDGDHGVA
jgi:signal transduction histidine kinase